MASLSKEMSVNIPVNDISKGKTYIDDAMAESLGMNKSVNRINAAIPLTTHILACPTNSPDPSARKKYHLF
jgi:hypothetical protein